MRRVSLGRGHRAAALAVVVLGLAAGCGDEATTPVPPPRAPLGFTAAVAGDAVHLEWSRPAATPVVRVVRRLNAAPQGAADPAASLVYEGAGDAADDALGELLPSTAATPRTYHYTAYGCDAAGNCEAAGSGATVEPALVACLRAGGYTIYWRHAAADVCEDRYDLGPAATTAVPGWWRSCEADCGLATARQLNATGVSQAIRIGNDVRARGIPIGRVVTSEFCRCVHSAELMAFGLAPEQDAGITLFAYDEAARCQTVTRWLATVPAAATNIALVAHIGFIPSCAAIPDDLASGAAVLYKPDGHGGATFIARVGADEWADLP